MTWIFKPDGTVMEVIGWPNPEYLEIPEGTWGYPLPKYNWGKVRNRWWQFYHLDHVPKELRAKALLLGD